MSKNVHGSGCPSPCARMSRIPQTSPQVLPASRNLNFLDPEQGGGSGTEIVHHVVRTPHATPNIVKKLHYVLCSDDFLCDGRESVSGQRSVGGGTSNRAWQLRHRVRPTNCTVMLRAQNCLVLVYSALPYLKCHVLWMLVRALISKSCMRGPCLELPSGHTDEAFVRVAGRRQQARSPPTAVRDATRPMHSAPPHARAQRPPCDCRQVGSR